MYFRPRCIGFARRRVGRGGRIILDRASTSYDDIWARLDYTILETNTECAESRLPEVVEIKRFDGVNVEKSADDERLLSQPSSVLNNHHNNNIVIKSENSKNQEISDDQMEVDRPSGEVNNQKLDDFEQLLDSANASSNIINKKLVCRNNSEMSEDSFLVRSIASGHSDALNKTLSTGLLNSQGSEASSSGVSSTNGSLLNSATETLQTDACKPTVTIDDEDEDELLKQPEPSEDFYMSLMDEIKNEWLHFRPKTPPYSSDDVLFDSDIMDKSKKFAVELQTLQMLDGDYQETDMGSYTDSVYLTQPMACNFANKSIVLSNDLVRESTTIKTEPVDTVDELMEVNDELPAKQTVEQDAVRKLLEKYQNDLADADRTIDIDIVNFNFDDCITDNEPIGCSKFNISACDLIENVKSEVLPKLIGNKVDESIVIKNEISEFSSEIIQDVTKEAPIAELQSHNYVLQYGPPVTSNMTLGSISNNIITCSPSVEGGISPATTLFQQQYINSGNAIISTGQQSQVNKLLYDSTIVLASPTRKQLNGPTDRNCKFQFQPL